VLHTALARLAEHGVDGTSIRRTADALGVTKAAIMIGEAADAGESGG
jgi:AcrR family transcriptional regulator